MNKQISTRVEILEGELQGQFGNIIEKINSQNYKVVIKGDIFNLESNAFCFVNPLVNQMWIDGKLEF